MIELPYHRVILGIFVNVVKDENTQNCQKVFEVVQAFEDCIPLAKKISPNEVNKTLTLYQNTLRNLCEDIHLIFMIEKKYV